MGVCPRPDEYIVQVDRAAQGCRVCCMKMSAGYGEQTSRDHEMSSSSAANTARLHAVDMCVSASRCQQATHDVVSARPSDVYHACVHSSTNHSAVVVKLDPGWGPLGPRPSRHLEDINLWPWPRQPMLWAQFRAQSTKLGSRDIRYMAEYDKKCK